MALACQADAFVKKKEEALLTIEQGTPKLQEANDGRTLMAIKRCTGWLLVTVRLCVRDNIFLGYVIFKHAKYGLNCFMQWLTYYYYFFGGGCIFL